MDLKMGYLGPEGTFSEEAARLIAGSNRRALQRYDNISDVIEAVQTGKVDEGIVPLENSLEGGVNITQDLLVGLEGVFIVNELIYPVNHCLLAKKSTALDEIDTVCSHPQALGQCRDYLRRKLPGAVCRPVESTAAAAALASDSYRTAAIAPRRAAELFKLEIMAEGIQDYFDNLTRFIVLARREQPPTGKDKTSLVLAIPDGPGSLYRILGLFARSNINLTRIESRPARRHLGDYLFFIDCEGHRSDPRLTVLLQKLQANVVFLKFLGSYPCSNHSV